MSTPHDYTNDILNDHEDPDGWATWAIGLGGAFLLIATVARGTGIYYRAVMAEDGVKNINISYEQRDMIIAAQQAVLEETAHWVRTYDPESGEPVDRLVIPIHDAMEIISGERTK